jgi:hypothetical protein
MYIKESHNLSATEAQERIDDSWDKLMEQKLPENVRIKDPEKSWRVNVMHFSFRARKGVLGVRLNGTLTVSEDSIAIRCQLPALVAKLIPEEEVVGVIRTHLAKTLAVRPSTHRSS